MEDSIAPGPAPDVRALLHRVADDAADWLDSLAERPVRPALTPAQMVVADGLPDAPTAVEDVLSDQVAQRPLRLWHRGRARRRGPPRRDLDRRRVPRPDPGGPREPLDWTPEFSRRARGVAVSATLRALGRDGVAELVDRLCACAEQFAARLAATDGFEVVAQGLNQTLVRVDDDDAVTAGTLAAVQADGTCWPSGTAWRGRGCIRLSVCNWQTTAVDVDRSVDALARAARDALAVGV
jgi:hypothetical protein